MKFHYWISRKIFLKWREWKRCRRTEKPNSIPANLDCLPFCYPIIGNQSDIQTLNSWMKNNGWNHNFVHFWYKIVLIIKCLIHCQSNFVLMMTTLNGKLLCQRNDVWLSTFDEYIYKCLVFLWNGLLAITDSSNG